MEREISGLEGLAMFQFYDDEDPRVVTFWIKEIELGGKTTAKPGHLQVSLRRFLEVFIDSVRLNFVLKRIFSKNVGFPYSRFLI